MLKLLSIAKGVIGWVLKNTAQIVGVVESLGKVIAGMVSFTPTKKDDWLIPVVDKVCSAIKKFLYDMSDKLMRKI